MEPQEYLSRAEEEVHHIPDLPQDTPVLAIERVAIIGAGTMGGGIAMAFANAGFQVLLVDAAAPALERGLETIRRSYERAVERGRLTAAEGEQRTGSIRGSIDIDDVADADLVIEAVFEEMEIKRKVFRRIAQVARADAILASNTSFLDVDELAQASGRPERVLGLHFFSPAHIMRLLEIVRGRHTAPQVLATALAVARRLGKVGVVVRVCYGFAGNRLIAKRREQGVALLQEGATPWQVDRVLEAFGFPMGLFAMSDMAGLDVGWRADTSQGATIKDRLCEMGRRGQKTGAGYYDYDAERRRQPSLAVEALIKDFRAEHGHRARPVDDQEILDRCLAVMINEGARLLEEKIVLRAADIDVVMVNGYGWPRERGGLMYYADSVGLPAIVATLQTLAAKPGSALAPAPLLQRLAAEGGQLHTVST